MSEPRPKVSVVMITYNHEKFIEQAVNSVLMQETDFDYEIIIGEDCSTDRTREILIELQKQHPDRIRLVLNPENLGMIPNFVNVLSMARGEYVALLEGDDYWTHPKKLQRQVDYMEAHPECRICFHAARVVYEDDRDRAPKIMTPPRSLPVTFENWLKYRLTSLANKFGTATIVFRSPNSPLPSWYYQLKAGGDWPLVLWLCLNGGEMAFIDDEQPMSVYRKHIGGATVTMHSSTSSLRCSLRDQIHDRLLIMRCVGKRIRVPLFFQLCILHLRLAESYISTDELASARVHARRSLLYLLRCLPWYVGFFRNNRTVALNVAKTFVRTHLPWLYSKGRFIFHNVRAWLSGISS